ncbi:MAG: 30S ribosomal protein S2 [Candidatus Wildermuthbacteria bacterium RIFCSPHIGHO2_01_FULL_45_20]|uniref:Small ribosomal subunit protein uS2 n=1 Tax=Candidatus Wildermuthbacteria bacterium RIFCSPHIGHO2_02_FULL_45_25 TaxID=1802450 RepID=A0A1G2QXZ2_9BACT|nr:MAG: 30S ribosomal protein S2 [Candidatus Wildermuthbacteria bacterium RIFCSPHIGHO2_01_FULL_45_20]OHA65495.1 MAG: 30S ribosomal protein S2 [Candidatus Wildermuthbacteria bacterium RIFCSPHIGHO2_02_FULL_45_25]
MDEMLAAGVHFGHKVSKTHPKMRQYIAGVRNTAHIINLEKTEEKLKDAEKALQKLAADGKTILFIGTKVQAKGPVKETAVECGMPYVAERWIGGLLTNFSEITKRIEYLKSLEAKQASEDFAKYTKKEQHDMQKEMEKLNDKFGGIKKMTKLPDAMFVVDLEENAIAVAEARLKKIPIFAISDTNTDPTTVTYAIPANNDAISSVRYILAKIKQAILAGKTSQPA